MKNDRLTDRAHMFTRLTSARPNITNLNIMKEKSTKKLARAVKHYN